MDQLLQNPAVQGGIAPFVVALIVAAIVGRISSFGGVAIIAGFCVTVALITGFSIQPLTSTRKIILLGVLASILGVVLQMLAVKQKKLPPVMFVIGASAVLWVLWPVLSRMEIVDALGYAAGLVFYAGWIAATYSGVLKHDTIESHAGAVAIGLGTGAVALIGASALLGQLGLSIGAAAMAVLSIYVVMRGKPRMGMSMGVTVGIVCGVLAPAAVAYAKVPWYALAFLAIVPVVGMVTLSPYLKIWLRASLALAIGMIPAGVAIFSTWKSAGPVPF